MVTAAAAVFKSSSKTIKAAFVRRIWLRSSQFSSQKVAYHRPRDSFEEGRRNILHRHHISGLLMAAMESRQAASLPICKTLLQQTFFCFR
jgi:hypothetical protein